MPWQDRLLTATYISPSGIPFNFIYEDVSIESDKKTATFNFPEIDGAYIQDLGRSGRRLQMNVFFSGDDYDFTSDSFLQALEETGIATIIHPRYGVRSVVPTGTITQTDALLTAANQASFSFTLSETLTGLTFPGSLQNTISDIKSGVSLFQTATATQFDTDLIIDTASGKIAIEQELDTQRAIINGSFETFVKVSEDFNASFQTINNSLSETIFEQTATNADVVADQSITFMRVPANIDNETLQKINLYEGIINNQLNKNYDTQVVGQETNNNFRANAMQAFAGLAASCESVLAAEFTTRPQAIDLAEKLLNIFDLIKPWYDAGLVNLNLVDTGESYESLLSLLSLSTAYLIGLSFELPAQRIKILGEERNCIELVSELYNDLEKLDFFIITNDLTADEIEILPAGKEVVYYA